MTAIGALLLGRRGPPGADGERGGGDVGRSAARHRRRVRAAYQLARPHPGQIAVAAELRHLLRESGFQRPTRPSHKVQDPYSLRCVPQVHGAVRDALDHLRAVLDIEMNSATDNPLVFPEGGVAAEDALATGGGRVISGGNFHGEPIALALDFAKIAIAELGSISERRTALLLDPRLNGGCRRSCPSGGLDSGLMIVQYTAAALVSENKVLAHPASVDSIPTSANQEDHVSMGPIAARHARTVLEHVERIVAIELRSRPRRSTTACACSPTRGRLERVPPSRPGAGVAEAHARIRAVVPPLAGDREPGPDLAAVTRLVHDGALVDLVAAASRVGGRHDRDPDRRRHRRRDVPARSRRAPIRASTIGRATTGRTPIAGRRPPGSPGWRVGPRPPRLPDRPPRQPVRAAEPGARVQPVRADAAALAARVRTRSRRRRRRRADREPVRPAPGRAAGGRRRRPRKLGLLGRGLAVFGSYAKVLLADEVAVGYAQFGPLSAYPRAQRLRDLYPQLPGRSAARRDHLHRDDGEARGHGHAAR
jgi:hypothetical protein